MKWLWLALGALVIGGGIYFYQKAPSSAPAVSRANPSGSEAPAPLTAPGLESSSGPLGGEITPRSDASTTPPTGPTPLPQPQTQTYPNPPVYPQPDPNTYNPPPDVPTYVPPPDQNYDTAEPPPPPPPPPAYVDPIPPDEGFDNGNQNIPPPPPPPVDEEF